jgi:hypothetical protein
MRTIPNYRLIVNVYNTKFGATSNCRLGLRSAYPVAIGFIAGIIAGVEYYFNWFGISWTRGPWNALGPGWSQARTQFHDGLEPLVLLR